MPSAGHCAGRTGTRFRALKNGHTPSVCQISRGAWRNLYNIARTIELRDPHCRSIPACCPVHLCQIIAHHRPVSTASQYMSRKAAPVARTGDRYRPTSG
jgi:hypothetical protein